MPVEIMVKRHGGYTYVFAVAMRGDATTATFQITDLPNKAHVEALGENRSLLVENRQFRDTFQPWDVHQYRIDEQ